MATRTIHTISYGPVELDLSGIEQLAEKSQTRAIAFALQSIAKQLDQQQPRKMSQLLKDLDGKIDHEVSLAADRQISCILKTSSDRRNTAGTGCIGTLVEVLRPRTSTQI